MYGLLGAADRRVRVRGPQMVPPREPRRRRQSPRSSRSSACMLALRDSFGQGIVIRETVGLDALRVLRRVRRALHRHHDRADQQRPCATCSRCSASASTSTTAISTSYFKAAMDTFFLLLILACWRKVRGARVRKPARAERAARRQDARQPGEPARLLVPDVDDGAGRAHRPDARRRAHQRAASGISPNGHTSGRVVGRIEGALGAGALYHRWLWLVHVLLRVRAAVLLPVHQAASSVFRAGSTCSSATWAARTARADQGFRKRRDLRRLAGRAIHLEATARHGRRASNAAAARSTAPPSTPARRSIPSSS